jgi:hypothetical protein
MPRILAGDFAAQAQRRPLLPRRAFLRIRPDGAFSGENRRHKHRNDFVTHSVTFFMRYYTKKRLPLANALQIKSTGGGVLTCVHIG